MIEKFKIQLLPENIELETTRGRNLLEILRDMGKAPEVPCGGNGTCGKCRVLVDGREVLACQMTVEKNLTVTLPHKKGAEILTKDSFSEILTESDAKGYALAFDIGTTTVVCYLLDANGREKATASMLNPQAPFGADVITRMQYALKGELETLTRLIRDGMEALVREVCIRSEIDPEEIQRISVVANPCMQQLFLGISPENLAKIPFDPVLTKTEIISAKTIFPFCGEAELLIVPDISGYVGADTVGCVLATKMPETEPLTLMVDIGTNGEMVLGNRKHMVACSTAAGPALEGAKIRFGMRAAQGAIEHIYLENEKLRCSVIGNTEATGICGSGLIDAVAVLLETGMINKRGRIQKAEDVPEFSECLKEMDGQRVVYLTEQIYLTQEDIREVQLAKGAIAAGITLMAEYLGVAIEEISHVLLAGAFGSYIRTESACRIGLLPQELEERMIAVGNAAGAGARIMACSKEHFQSVDALLEKVEFLELASLPGFQQCFAKKTGF